VLLGTPESENILTSESGSQKKLGAALFYGIIILLAYLVYLIFAPFLVALAWAAVLVVVSYPVYEYLCRRWGPTGAALASTVGVTLILIAPTLAVMAAFVRQAVDAVQSIQLGVQAGHYSWIGNFWLRLQQRYPSVIPNDFTGALHHYAQQAASYVGEQLGTLLRHTAEFLFHLTVTILAMFYLYRDGDSIVDRLRELLPFEEEQREKMVYETHDLIHASVISTLAAAAAHGVLGGVAFAVVGFRAPLFWGVMMGFFSLLPVVGSALIWGPIAVSLMLGGHIGRGIFLIFVCAVIVGLVDNFIRPWLISGRAQMGGLVVFISVLGGIAVFGLLGVVLGPIIVALAASLLDLYVPARPDRNLASKQGEKRKAAVLE
jgi:predicted PurR-regulated permease PerM